MTGSKSTLPPRVNRKSGDMRKVVALFDTHETITRQQIADTMRCGLDSIKVQVQSWLKHGYIRLESKGDAPGCNRYKRGPRAPKNRYVQPAQGATEKHEMLEAVLCELEETDLSKAQVQRIVGLDKVQTRLLIAEWTEQKWIAPICDGSYTLGGAWLKQKMRRVTG